MSESISRAARSAPPAAPNTQEQSQLNKLVRKYRSDVTNNASADVLATLARQINAAANVLGTRITLPKPTGGGATATHEAAGEPPAKPPGDGAGKVNRTA